MSDATMHYVSEARMRKDVWISAAGIGLAMLTCVGCGGGHDSASVTGSSAHPPAAGFTATLGRPLPGSPTPTLAGSGGAATPTVTPPTTPVVGTETVTPTVSVTPTRTVPGEPHGVLRIGHARGEPGATVSLDIVLAVDQGVDISGTQNDFSFEPGAIAVRENADGDPDCAVNPQLDLNGSRFGFQPTGCGVDAACTGVRAIVLSFTSVVPIPGSPALYTCNVAISAAAEPGTVYPLLCSDAGASSPDGVAIEINCEDGAIEVAGSSGPESNL